MHQPGDKVRLKPSGERAVVVGVSGDRVTVRVGDVVTEVDAAGLTNYSDAARRAWAVRPKKAGRPRLDAPRKKMVALRFDLDVLDLIALLVEHGLVANREQAVNEWCREVATGMLRRSGVTKGIG